MSLNKKIGCFLGCILLLFCIFYSGVYYFAHTENQESYDSTQTIGDLGDVDPNYLSYVQTYINMFELDSNRNFKPQDNLTRMDALIIIDKIAKQVDSKYNTTKPTIVPYFDDFKSSDSNSDVVLRVVNLIDSKDGYYKHYNILGYQLNKQDAITNREFLTLLAVFLPVDKSIGDDYILKNMINYGFDLDGNLDEPISRQKAAYYISKIMSNFSNKK